MKVSDMIKKLSIIEKEGKGEYTLCVNYYWFDFDNDCWRDVTEIISYVEVNDNTKTVDI